MKTDRRIQRTRQMLRDSLIDLILERGYDAVTIQDITDHANLARATFYLHYRDKEELLINSLEEMFDSLVKRIPENPHEGAAGLLAFQHAAEHRDLYRIMLNGQASNTVYKRVRAYLTRTIQERIEMLRNSLYANMPAEIVATHIAGSLFALIAWWLENDCPYSAEYMAQLFLHLNSLPDPSKNSSMAIPNGQSGKVS